MQIATPARTWDVCRDLEYLGNTVVAEWKGCPPAVLAKLGLTGDNA